MPHSLFLGSALATQDRISFRATTQHSHPLSSVNTKDTDGSLEVQPAEKVSWIRRFIAESKESILSAFRKPPAKVYSTAPKRHSDWANNSYEFVRAHIYHGTFDMIGSLLGFAVMINSL